MHIQAVRMCTYEVRKAKKQAIYDAKAAAKAEAEASSEGGGATTRRTSKLSASPQTGMRSCSFPIITHQTGIKTRELSVAHWHARSVHTDIGSKLHSRGGMVRGRYVHR